MTRKLHTLACPALLAAVILCAAAPSWAQGTPVQSDGPPRMEINLAGVDVTTLEGMEMAHHRISNAARAVCAELPDTDGWHLQKSACIQTARADAKRQLTDLQGKILAQRARAGKMVDYALKTR
jgi:UrcA family protein